MTIKQLEVIGKREEDAWKSFGLLECKKFVTPQ